MSDSFGIDRNCVCHAIGTENTRSEARRSVDDRATRSLSRSRKRPSRRGSTSSSRSCLYSKGAGSQDCVGTVPLYTQKGRRSSPRTENQFGRGLATQSVRILPGRDLVEQHLDTLNGKVLEERCFQVPRHFLVEAFRIKIGIEGYRGPPSVGELATSE